MMIKRVDDLYVRQRVIKATAFSSRWGDTISIMSVVSSPRQIIAKITLICFRFTGNTTRMAAVKLIAPTWSSIDIPASSTPLGQWVRTKDIKEYFTKSGVSSMSGFAAWLMAWILKHCQRHNGPKGWVLLTKLTSFGHITSSYTNLDQTSSESWPSTNFKISTKHQHFDKT